MDYLGLWGKTGENGAYHPLACHMLDAAAVADALPAPSALAALTPAWLRYLIALHDIGKADPWFQVKDAVQADRLRVRGFALPHAPEPFRHEARSARWAKSHLQQVHAWGLSAAVVAARSLRGHHGAFDAPLSRDDEQDHPQRFAEWEGVRDDLAAALWDVIRPEPHALAVFRHASAIGVALSGFVVLADWIASNPEVFRSPELAPGDDLAAYAERTQEEACRAVARLGLSPCGRAETGTPRFVELWPACTTLRPVQRALEEACLSGLPPGLAIIEAPMGEGKTEAAVYLAEEWRRQSGRRGTYLALPTAATSNQMHDRYGAFLARRDPAADAPRLVHGMAWLLDDVTPEQPPVIPDGAAEADRALDWFRPMKRALLAPEGVGTIDQALMAALNVKHGFLRLFGLSGKVLVIDEVHAYDTYMSTILERLLAWCRALEIPVILLSATLATAQKRRLVAAYTGGSAQVPASAEGYPLLTLVPFDGDSQTISVPADPARERQVIIRQHHGLLDDPARTARLALDAVQYGGCACVLVNTVSAAQTTFLKLRDSAPADVELFLFHARFRAERRQTLERQVVGLFGKDAWEDRPRRAILVATQVVEQSLDVDFDVMISQIAPIDLLLQRSGRLHRHERGSRPTGKTAALHVLLPEEGAFDFGVTQCVYQPEVLLRTVDLLRDKDSLSIPGDLRPLVEACYTLDSPCPSIPAEVLAGAVAKRRKAEEDASNQASVHLVPDPSPRVFKLAEHRWRPVEEGDGTGGGNYFHAQTRLGSTTRPVLILHDPELVKATSASPPDHDTMKRLFLQKVDLPAKWFRGLTDARDQPIETDGPRWLRNHIVLALEGGVWCGYGKDGKPVTIRDDADRGLVLEGGEGSD